MQTWNAQSNGLSSTIDRSGGKPAWDLFVSSPARRVRRNADMKRFRVPQRLLADYTALKEGACGTLDPERTPQSMTDWFVLYGRPEPKSRFACCQSRKTPDNRLYGGSLTLYGEQCSGGTMRTAVFQRKGGGTNQFTAAKHMQSGKG